MNNLSFLLPSAFLLFFVFVLVGAMVSIFFYDFGATNKRNHRLQKLNRAVLTAMITLLMALLIFWTNLRLSGAVHWLLGDRSNINHSSGISPTADIDS